MWVRERHQPAFPDDSITAGLLGCRTESCSCDGTFRHRVILINAVPADPDCTQQNAAATIDRLASGEGDNAMVPFASPVIANSCTCKGPKRIGIPDAKQRRHPCIRANVCSGRASWTIWPGEQPDRLAVQREVVAAKGYCGIRFRDRDFNAPPPRIGPAGGRRSAAGIRRFDEQELTLPIYHRTPHFGPWRLSERGQRVGGCLLTRMKNRTSLCLG